MVGVSFEVGYLNIETAETSSRVTNDSDWHRALKSQDCKALMALLKANPCLVTQMGPEGWTVLHVAARKGCLQLLYQVFILFNNKGQFVDETSGVKIAWDDLLRAKCGTFEAEAQDIAWFTCPRQVLEFLKPGIEFGDRFSSIQISNFDTSQHLRAKLVEIMQRQTPNSNFKNLERHSHDDENYNFVLERKELQFHYACQILYWHVAENCFKTVIDGCLELGPSESIEVLTYLFQLHNAQGQTPFHVASSRGCIPELLRLVPPGNAYKECLNAKDVRGWTTLHYVAATRQHHALEALLKDERIDANARTGSTINGIRDELEAGGMTALHLAILHNDAESVELLLQCPHTDVNALFKRHIVCGYERMKLGEDLEIQERTLYWSPLQLASIMGLSDVVRVLLVLKLCDIDDDGKLLNNNIVGGNFRRVSALLLAFASGNPDTLRLFLDNPMFNPLVKFELQPYTMQQMQ